MPKPAAQDLITDYLERLELKKYSAHTLRAYKQDLRQAEQVLGAPLHLVKEPKLQAYAAGLARSLKPTSVRRKHASLRAFFEHCRRVKARIDDPCVNFEAPRMEDRLPKYLNDGQIDKLLAVLRSETVADLRERAIVCCFYYTGMRAGELVGLDVEDLALEERELRVFGKGRRERMLPVPDQLAEALAAWLAAHPIGTGPLFVRLDSAAGGRLHYDAVAGVVKGAFARAGLARWRFSCHKLRHTFATRLVNRKVRIDKIQKLMGHRKIDTTTIYAHTELGQETRDELSGAL